MAMRFELEQWAVGVPSNWLGCLWCIACWVLQGLQGAGAGPGRKEGPQIWAACGQAVGAELAHLHDSCTKIEICQGVITKGKYTHGQLGVREFS